MTRVVNIAQSGGNNVTMRNRIINGAMMIDQRNAGASVSTSSGASVYTVDRFQLQYSQTSKMTAQQNAGSVTPPSGFINYLGVTSSSAYSLGSTDYFTLTQKIEGYNVADLGWGAAGASTVTLSFWVRSSLTGAFGGIITNTNFDRSYPFTYTISAANTWEQKTITIAGDTTGTWNKTNGTNIQVQFGLGVGSTYSGTAGAWAATGLLSATGAVSVVGTNGATWYVTGVQLEAGTTATPFEQRLYGTELALCQRYFETYALNNTSLIGNSTSGSGGSAVLTWHVPKRTAPSVTLPAAGNSSGTVSFLTAGGAYPATVGTNVANDITVDKATIYASGYSGLTVGGASIFWSSGTSTIQISAEL